MYIYIYEDNIKISTKKPIDDDLWEIHDGSVRVLEVNATSALEAEVTVEEPDEEEGDDEISIAWLPVGQV